MSFKIILAPVFEKELKKNSAKYPSFKSDFRLFLDSLVKDPTQGISLGNNCYKIRLAGPGKGRGKSGGATIITHIKIIGAEKSLISIFDKSSRENISIAEINERIKDLNY
jgi:mRNA-degrading endonuclease RelE of RelBE toxin-antitoxin system